MNGFVSKSDFAKIYGCTPQYISKLVKEQRIVLDESGRQVNVEATLALLANTSDPSKVGVRERWEAYRAGGGAAPQRPSLPALEAAVQPKESTQDRSRFHDARADRERAQAQLAQLELRQKLGELAEVGPVLKAVTDTHTAARSAILALADRLTPLVAPEIDPVKVHGLILAECRRICEDMQTSAQNLAFLAAAEVQA